MSTSLPETLTKTPEIPKEIGEDGGQFYKYYDELAEASDEELVKSLKAQLDGIIIFAGLFAGINSAFLTLTLPQMSANPANDTNALLFQIALGGNRSITSAADLPSASFTPPPRIYPINILFSVSLTLALLSSFLSVVGQQWIVYYRKRVSGGPDYQRWERLQRYLGANRWQLEFILDDVVPSLLQLGLAIFCIAFALYLGTLSQSLNRIITWFLCVAGATIIAMSACSTFDPWCPFKLPLFHMARRAVSAIASTVIWFGRGCYGAGIVLTAHLINVTWKVKHLFLPRGVAMRHTRPPNDIKSFSMLVENVILTYIPYYRWCMSLGARSAGDPGDLKLEAVKRVICASEDHNALIYSAVNILVVRDARMLSSLGKDEQFCTRLSGLALAAFRETQQRQTSSPYSFIESGLFSTGLFHFMFSTCSDPFFTHLHQFDASAKLKLSYDQMNQLHQASVVAFDTSRDQYSHCAPLLFSIRVTCALLEAMKTHTPLQLGPTFTCAVGMPAGAADLRLGFMVASVMLLCQQIDDEITRPYNRFLKLLFDAYRETSEQKMFPTISRALATVGAQWRRTWWPDHEIYAWLFEFWLSPERKEVSVADKLAVLEHVDDHLLSIEGWIRSGDVSVTDCQHGRDYQHRYVQSVAKFFSNRADSSHEMWALVGPPLERYLRSVKTLMEADPGNWENPGTSDVLRYIESSFPEPRPLRQASANEADREQEQDPQRTAYLQFRRLLDQIDLTSQATISMTMQGNTLQFSEERIRDKPGGPSEIARASGLWGN